MPKTPKTPTRTSFSTKSLPVEESPFMIRENTYMWRCTYPLSESKTCNKTSAGREHLKEHQKSAHGVENVAATPPSPLAGSCGTGMKDCHQRKVKRAVTAPESPWSSPSSGGRPYFLERTGNTGYQNAISKEVFICQAADCKFQRINGRKFFGHDEKSKNKHLYDYHRAKTGDAS